MVHVSSRTGIRLPGPTVGLAVMAVAMLVAVLPGSPFWLAMSGMTAALAIGLPIVLSSRVRVAEMLLPIACASVVVITSFVAWSRANDHSLSPRDRNHDGGVIVTEAAAEDILHGRNPYATDFGTVLPPSWDKVQASDGAHVANPVRWHFPYLPAAAMVHVPFMLAGDALGVGWDTRVLGCAVLAIAVWVMARRPAPAWARLGAVLGIGSVFSVMFLAWGTNDVLAAGLALWALCLAERRPELAGVLLAVALSTKLLLVVLLPPLALAIWLTGGWAAVRRWWTLPALLAVTSVPLFIVDPSSFVDDIFLFNLGRSDVNMPVSGIGLPAVAPSFDGLPLALVTVLGAMLALVGPLWAVWRRPSIWVAASAAGLALIPLLIPARTFQDNYLVLVAALVPLYWLSATVETASDADVTGAEPNMDVVATAGSRSL